LFFLVRLSEAFTDPCARRLPRCAFTRLVSNVPCENVGLRV
jgi:hypothetical protein